MTQLPAQPATSQPSVRLQTATCHPSDLSPAERTRLYQLMCEHFTLVRREPFERDLAEKELVFLVRNAATSTIEGFSTLMPLATECDGRPLVALFSGDTVIAPQYWGDRQFVRVVGRCLFDWAARFEEANVYWLLLTCTHRSYRFLPGFFRRYYPNLQQPMPAEVKRHLDALVRLKFADEYNAQRGVVELREPLMVRAERIKLASRPLDEPSIRFFHEANPTYARGDYLACLAELTPANTTPLAQRLFGLPSSGG